MTGSLIRLDNCFRLLHENSTQCMYAQLLTAVDLHGTFDLVTTSVKSPVKVNCIIDILQDAQ